jgi:hypothetical protein
MTERFVVYQHKRPDGSVFYVGKGLVHRAFDLAPSRRTEWHNNIVAKYGRDNIVISYQECESEAQAFELERETIKTLRLEGVQLINLTDGGEGCSGRKPTSKQLESLNRGRQKGKRGVCGPRPQLAAWRKTEEGKAHIKSLSDKTRGVKKTPRYQAVCLQCGESFSFFSERAKFCGKNCQQRHSRAKDKEVV